MKITIPAVISYECDACGEASDAPFDCKLKIDQVGRDYQGHAVGGNTVERELCHKCVVKMNSLFKRSI